MNLGVGKPHGKYLHSNFRVPFIYLDAFHFNIRLENYQICNLIYCNHTDINQFIFVIYFERFRIVRTYPKTSFINNNEQVR